VRHFFFTSADGQLLGSATAPGGYNDEWDLSDPGCGHPLVVGQLKSAAKVANFDRFVEFVCPCPSSVGCCSCPDDKIVETYAEGSVLMTKAILTVLVDSVSTETVAADSITRPVGSTITLKLQGDIPDDEQIVVRNAGKVALLPEELTLTFTDGETPTVDLTTPAIGMVGMVLSPGSKYVRQFRIMLQGGA